MFVAAVQFAGMNERDRFKLLGKYRTPRFKYGATVTCAIRGPVKIMGLSDGRIPWPKCRAGKRARAIILYGALAEAVRQESAQAVEYWWGVGSFTVWQWRKALGVDRMNEGTESLWQRWSPETCQSKKANKKRAPALKSPERGAKIAAAMTGRKRPSEVVEAMRRASTGRKASKEARGNLSIMPPSRHATSGRADGITPMLSAPMFVASLRRKVTDPQLPAPVSRREPSRASDGESGCQCGCFAKRFAKLLRNNALSCISVH